MNKEKLYLDKLNYYNLTNNTYKINKYHYKLEQIGGLFNSKYMNNSEKEKFKEDLFNFIKDLFTKETINKIAISLNNTLNHIGEKIINKNDNDIKNKINNYISSFKEINKKFSIKTEMVNYYKCNIIIDVNNEEFNNNLLNKIKELLNNNLKNINSIEIEFKINNETKTLSFSYNDLVENNIIDDNKIKNNIKDKINNIINKNKNNKNNKNKIEKYYINIHSFIENKFYKYNTDLIGNKNNKIIIDDEPNNN